METLFHGPSGIALDAQGTLYVSEFNGHRIRMVRHGRISTIAGNGAQGFVDGPVTISQVDSPSGIAVAPDGTVYFSDCYNHAIRMIRDGVVTTLVGNRGLGLSQASASQTSLRFPSGIAVSSDRTVYFCDRENHCIRVFRDGVMRTFAGLPGQAGSVDGSVVSARFCRPRGITVGPGGTVYVGDSGNGRVRMIRDGQVSTLAQLTCPVGVALSPNGSLYVVDQSECLVKMIRGIQTRTVAGSGASGSEDGPAARARFNDPWGIILSPQGTLYVSDVSGNALRMIRNGCVATFEYIPSKASGINLEKSMAIATTSTIQIGDDTIEVHASFIERRCPQLLKPALRLHPVSSQAVSAFHKFLYTDELPGGDIGLRSLVGLSYLLFAMDRKSTACLLLARLQRDVSAEVHRENTHMQDLVQLYSYCLDLSTFGEAQKVVLYLLQENVANLRPLMKSVPQWLGKHSDRFIDLVQDLLVPFDSLQRPYPTETMPVQDRDNVMSISEALGALYLDRHNSGDFEIAIRGDARKSSEKVHSFVMHAVWPYFRHMYDAGMKEKQQRRLELPAQGEDGGMSSGVLELLIEMCYRPDTFDLNCVHADLAMEILPIAHLYLGSGENAEDTASSVFSPLVAFVENQVVNGLTLDKCVQVYQQALRYGMTKVVNSSRKLIIQNIKTLISTPERAAELKALPKSIIFDLFSTCALTWE